MERGNRTGLSHLVVACQMLADGYSRAQIGNRLDVSPPTVQRLIERAAVLWLQRYKADRRAERLDDLTDLA